MNTIFCARVYKWIIIKYIIDVPEPLVYNFEDLCNELVALDMLKWFDLNYASVKQFCKSRASIFRKTFQD
jgi:hypothetical protein